MTWPTIFALAGGVALGHAAATGKLDRLFVVEDY
jgi:hypothetical protein